MSELKEMYEFFKVAKEFPINVVYLVLKIVEIENELKKAYKELLIEINKPGESARQFVTELLEKDVPLTLVADLVGHKNLNTTKDNYGNYSKSKARDAHRKYVA